MIFSLQFSFRCEFILQSDSAVNVCLRNSGDRESMSKLSKQRIENPPFPFQRHYTAFAVRNEPEPVLRYHSIRTRLSTHLCADSGHLKTKLFLKRQKNFREQWSVPNFSVTKEFILRTPCTLYLQYNLRWINPAQRNGFFSILSPFLCWIWFLIETETEIYKYFTETDIYQDVFPTHYSE